jgi:hypothetical protein
MDNKELEEKIYEFGNVLYRIGRMETDEKETTKEYNKMCKRREELTEEFNKHFKSSINKKLAASLNLI